jgi:hypothetical protein
VSVENQIHDILSGPIATLMGTAVGAFLAFFGTVYAQRSERNAARRAAGRAVLAEMFTNADRALSAESTLVLHEFTDFAWRQQLPLVADLISWEDLKVLVNTYDSATRAFENAKEVVRNRSGRDDAEAYEPNFGRMASWFHDVAAEWVAAMRVLQKTVLDRNERQKLDEDIKKLEQRLR